MAAKTTKEQLFSMRDAVDQKSQVPNNIKDSVTKIVVEYSNYINSERGLARDAHKGLLLSLVQELLVMPEGARLNTSQIESRLKLIRPTLEFMRSVLSNKLKNEHEYSHALKEKVQELEQKMIELENRRSSLSR